MSDTNASLADRRAAALNRRDRTVILLALFGITAIAWLYLLTMPQDMSDMDMDSMPGMAAPWTPGSRPAGGARAPGGGPGPSR